jgi:uroporphyrinogen-III decarboxylase
MGNTKMKAKERVKIAMSNGKPDRVPVVPQICTPHAVKMLGLDYETTILEAIRRPELLNKLDYECCKRYGVDGMRAWILPDPQEVVQVEGRWYGRDPNTGKRLGIIDFEGGGGILHSEEPTLNTLEDIDRISVTPADQIVKSGKLNSIKEIIKDAGEDMFISSAPGFFTVEYLTFVRGKTQAMIDLLDDPDFCHRALEKSLAVAIQNALALASIGVDGLYIGDTYGGVISPAQFKEFCVPYIKRFVAAVKGKGPLIYLHICGNSTRILEMMAETGVDCIEPLDPLGGVSVADAKKRVGKRVALMGGVHTVKLAHGTLSEVKADIHRCLSEGSPGGGYILAAGDMLPTETSKEKVEAMLEMAKDFKY